MNEKDLKIIANLRQDARIPLTLLSRRISVPVSTIFDRMKSSEGRYITKHTCLLNFESLGFNARAKVTLKVDRKDKEALRDYLIRSEHVNSVYHVTSDYDFMIEAVFPQIKDLEAWKDNLEKRFNILDSKTYFIIDDLKREAFLCDPNLLPPAKSNPINSAKTL